MCAGMVWRSRRGWSGHGGREGPLFLPCAAPLCPPFSESRSQTTFEEVLLSHSQLILTGLSLCLVPGSPLCPGPRGGTEDLEVLCRLQQDGVRKRDVGISGRERGCPVVCGNYETTDLSW